MKSLYSVFKLSVVCTSLALVGCPVTETMKSYETISQENSDAFSNLALNDAYEVLNNEFKLRYFNTRLFVAEPQDIKSNGLRPLTEEVKFIIKDTCYPSIYTHGVNILIDPMSGMINYEVFNKPVHREKIAKCVTKHIAQTELNIEQLDALSIISKSNSFDPAIKLELQQSISNSKVDGHYTLGELIDLMPILEKQVLINNQAKKDSARQNYDTKFNDL